MRQATFGARAPVFTIRFLSGVAGIALLAGCQTGPLAGSGGGDATRALPVGDSVKLIERDVEAPEIFRAQDRALWDGRPSLGGVWVAAPNIRDPERVIIRNEENGKFVIGALFRRERDNPGPPLQLSSDAAVALGIIAGAPTSVDVVALRREEAEEPAPAPEVAIAASDDAAEADLAAEEIVQAAPVPTEDLIETAGAALDASSDAIATTGAAVAETATAPVRTAVKTPEKRGFFGRLFRRDVPAPEPAVLSATRAEWAEDAAAEPAPVAGSAAIPSVEATSLDIDNVEPTSAAPEPRPTPVATGTLDRAYIQIGIFSQEENARNTATSLANVGVLPTVLEQESQGRQFWRVIVGPATTASDRAAVLRKAQDLGFEDAYAVSG
ncbi:MAG: SPOR domain-containing protein [Pseudomonadota bacterium]